MFGIKQIYYIYSMYVLVKNLSKTKEISEFTLTYGDSWNEVLLLPC